MCIRCLCFPLFTDFKSFPLISLAITYLFFLFVLLFFFSGNKNVNCSYSIDRGAFIFSLYNTQGYNPIKLPLKDTGAKYAVYTCYDHMVMFGQGPDLVVRAEKGNTKPQSYNSPSKCSEREACHFFAGKSPFNTSDVEIFYLESSSP